MLRSLLNVGLPYFFYLLSISIKSLFFGWRCGRPSGATSLLPRLCIPAVRAQRSVSQLSNNTKKSTSGIMHFHRCSSVTCACTSVNWACFWLSKFVILIRKRGADATATFSSSSAACTCRQRILAQRRRRHHEVVCNQTTSWCDDVVSTEEDETDDEPPTPVNPGLTWTRMRHVEMHRRRQVTVACSSLHHHVL